jgi:hypothetical protein
MLELDAPEVIVLVGTSDCAVVSDVLVTTEVVEVVGTGF